MVIGLASFIDISEKLYALNKGIKAIILPFNLFLIIPCFLYLYVIKASILKEHKKDYLVFIPGIIDILIGIGILCFSTNITEIQNSTVYNIYQIFSLLYFPVIVILILLKIRKNSKLLAQQYSSTENRELRWAGLLVTIILGYMVTFPFIFYFASDFLQQILDSLFWLFVTFWATYNGLLQQTSQNLIVSADPINNQKSIDTPQLSITKNKEEKRDVDLEKYTLLFKKIETLIIEDQLFLNPELTISEIGTKIQEHPRLISTTINTISGKNFNTYINLFRVEHAKTLLLSGRSVSINIESIGLESGFKSNSSFYNAFKKNMNLTPLQYLKTKNEHTKAG